MSRLVKNLVLFVIVFHVAAFVIEAFLWMRPVVHEPMLRPLTGAVDVAPRDQAAILRSLFVNQGFYNLFLALSGISGLVLARRGEASAGYALVAWMCLSALAAGLVLAATTHAWVGAVLQGGPAAAALVPVVRVQRASRRA